MKLDLNLFLKLFLPPIILFIFLKVVDGTRSIRRVRERRNRKSRSSLSLTGRVYPRNGHTHKLMQSSPSTFVTSIDRDHLHTVKLNEEEIQRLNLEGHIEVESEIVQGHSHTVTITI